MANPPNVSTFSAALDRLKSELRVKQDQEVATALGLSKAAFSERKKRHAFPEDKLFGLVARRPELNIDTLFVLTGQRSTMQTQSQLQRMVETTAAVGDPAVTEAAGRAFRRVAHQSEESLYDDVSVPRDGPHGNTFAGGLQELMDLLGRASPDDIRALLPVVRRIVREPRRRT